MSLEPENPVRGGPQGGGCSIAVRRTGVENIPREIERLLALRRKPLVLADEFQQRGVGNERELHFGRPRPLVRTRVFDRQL